MRVSPTPRSEPYSPLGNSAPHPTIAPMPTKTHRKDGRGHNRRWRDDPVVLRRVELVGNLYDHPRSTALAAVNAWLERQGEDTITLDTIGEDRRRYKELLRDRITDNSGVQGRLEQLQRLHDEMWRRLRQIPDPYGNPAAAVAAVILRAIEDSSKLDGSWGAGGVEINLQVDTSGFGRTPQQQLAAGDISEQEYLTALRVLHAHTNSGRSPVQPPEPEGEIIEGSASEVTEPPRPRSGPPRPSTGPQIHRNGNTPPLPPRRRMADDIDVPVIDLDGEELDDLR